MPPEYTKVKQYDDFQGTVWQMGILLVDMMLSTAFRTFKHPRDASTKPPYVPKHLSPGNCFFLFFSDCFATNNPIEAIVFFCLYSVIGKCCQSQEICLQYFVNITILGQNACWMLQKTIHLARKTFPNFFRVLSMKLCHLSCSCCSTEVKNFIHWLLDTKRLNCPRLREILKHPWIAHQTN